MPPFDMQLMNDKGIAFEFHYGPLGAYIVPGVEYRLTHLKVCLQALDIVPARTVVAEDGQTNALPSTPSTTMLGKRSRLQYEDISSLSVRYFIDLNQRARLIIPPGDRCQLERAYNG